MSESFETRAAWAIHFISFHLICQMQTTDNATTKQRTQWQDSKAQHALTAALGMIHTNCKFIHGSVRVFCRSSAWHS